MGGMGRPGSIVANARKELGTMQKTSLPRSRMSVEGLRAMPKGLPMMQGGKMSIGLPTISTDGKNMPTSKSLAASSYGNSYNKISLYKNDEERQSFMKIVSEQQNNYQRLLVQKKHTGSSQIPIKVKIKSTLEQKNMNAFQKAAPIAPKQRRSSMMSK